MSHPTDPAWLLLIPFLAILTFLIWALWNFTGELRAVPRRRNRRALYPHQVRICLPEAPLLRFQRSQPKKAA